MNNVTIDSDGYIIIPIVIGGNTYAPYEISSDAVIGREEIWLSHLSDKRWFTPALRRSLEELLRILSVSIYQLN